MPQAISPAEGNLGNYPWPLALDVERAFHPCNMTEETIPMKLTWYGHSAFRIEAGAAKILLDPFLSDSPSWDKGWIGSRADEDSTQGGGR
jgi:hypothetical protein